MHASDVMTRTVISANADTPVREVAGILLEHGISAVPVLGPDGVLIGMVSEGDLVSRDELARAERRDWWLKMIADPASPSSDFLARLRAPDRTAGDVMSAPVITVTEDTDLAEIARLLAQHHIKRVPVVKDGRVIGIVSRADLLCAVASPRPEDTASGKAAPKSNFLLNLFGGYQRPAWEVISVESETSPAKSSAGIDAKLFRGLVDDFQTRGARDHDAALRAAAEERQRRAKELIDTHLSDETWRELLQHARQAAEAGMKESLLLQFPTELCTDGGRAIDVSEAGWPATLRGEAAELYLRWERELKRRGFHLIARIVDYPEGKPGDVGLFLSWGE
jgi:CBS domain-containing protein